MNRCLFLWLRMLCRVLWFFIMVVKVVLVSGSFWCSLIGDGMVVNEVMLVFLILGVISMVR